MAASGARGWARATTPPARVPVACRSCQEAARPPSPGRRRPGMQSQPFTAVPSTSASDPVSLEPSVDFYCRCRWVWTMLVFVAVSAPCNFHKYTLFLKKIFIIIFLKLLGPLQERRRMARNMYNLTNREMCEKVATLFCLVIFSLGYGFSIL